MMKYFFEKGISFFTINDAFVARGACFSFVSDYAHISDQIVKMVNKIVEGKLAASEIDIVPPTGVNLAVNMTSLQRIGVEGMLI